MDDQAAAPATLDTLSAALRVALMDTAEAAIRTVNGALNQLHRGPAQSPTDALAWREAVTQEAGWRCVRLWNSLEPADLRVAGAYLALAIVRQTIDQGHAGSEWLRQQNIQLPLVPGERGASPAPDPAA